VLPPRIILRNLCAPASSRVGRTGHYFARAGVELWAVSSTNKWVIAEGVRAFGIPESRVLAAEVRVVDSVISSEIVTYPPTRAKPHRSASGPGSTAFCLRELHSRPGDVGHRTQRLPVNLAALLVAAANGMGFFRPSAAEESIRELRRIDASRKISQGFPFCFHRTKGHNTPQTSHLF